MKALITAKGIKIVEQADFHIQLGRLYWSRFNDTVSYAKHQGYKVDVWQSSGILSRSFEVIGDKKAVDWIEKEMKNFINFVEKDVDR